MYWILHCLRLLDILSWDFRTAAASSSSAGKPFQTDLLQFPTSLEQTCALKRKATTSWIYFLKANVATLICFFLLFFLPLLFKSAVSVSSTFPSTFSDTNFQVRSPASISTFFLHLPTLPEDELQKKLTKKKTQRKHNFRCLTVN